MRTTVRDVLQKAGEEPITMLTAYDAVTATLVDEQGVDVILVGDSVGNTQHGHETTLPVTVDQMADHTAAVARGAEDALVVADMPFLSYGADESESIENAGRMLKESGAHAVKLESGEHTVDLTEQLSRLGIPVMAHLGLTPQSVNQQGYALQGTSEEAADRMVELARAHEDAGAFSLVLERVPASLASRITEAIEIPTIGIGAGPHCDGQVLVVDDAVGLSDWTPSFVEEFGDVREAMADAIEAYADAVESGEFPAAEHSEGVEELDDLY
ncbi:3-methyl-2-oxobutanoate hydroxymethyltransferase [Halorubellus sp. JP-L1]|uniref:3-methyl-2-oxobutanoate hydroxymethyltransferase n=1 Tax=Halorubellus sp. JP-L1 TaxID=2715753 RepID=UPI0014074DCF|nr:3-methyl-2-oxobutanoate hydroxymethyltransferase [Halorubellus sp. JP-L1]NHN41045.1 3-methyl-2-oxobutanoate hydroxymethyltransferase [Halorubellus sp. JP-L1]